LLLVGQVGTEIINGIVTDASNNRWLLPASVVIPPAGQITATATAEALGAITALPNTITQITTPTRGWQTVTNPTAAAAGAPVETDAALRRRQAISTSLPSQTLLAGILGALRSIAGVTRAVVFENDTTVTDNRGIPARSLAAVVEGGLSGAIGEALLRRKTLGVNTFGSTVVNTIDDNGVDRAVRFSRPAIVPIDVEVTLTALPGYTTVVGDAIRAAVAARLNECAIGESSLLSRLWTSATLPGDSRGTLFDITQIRQRRGANAFTAGNVVLVWNEAASGSTANVTLIVS
jgi:uncharacterized phage protein gp47/JayE